MEEKENVVHNFPDNNFLSMSKSVIFFYAAVLILGIATGYLLVRLNHGTSVMIKTRNGTVPQTLEAGKTYGSSDTTRYKDQAEGVLRVGGIDGEGAYHLERTGGISQNVYLTSDVLDLSAFVGKKIKVWGETNTAKKAGWLMNVGAVQPLE